MISTEVQSITSVESRLDAVYGFGSAFRDELFSDIDILAVAKDGPMLALDTFYALKVALHGVTKIYDAPVHLTILTEIEFASRPLRRMSELILLWKNSEESA